MASGAHKKKLGILARISFKAKSDKNYKATHSEDESPEAAVPPKKKKSKGAAIAGSIIKAVLFLFVCFVLISPLKGCVLGGGDFIGAEKAQKIAIADSGVAGGKVSKLDTDMIQIDDDFCYKIQFTGSVTDYRYIIDAETGDIIAQVFYHTDG